MNECRAKVKDSDPVEIASHSRTNRNTNQNMDVSNTNRNSNSGNHNSNRGYGNIDMNRRFGCNGLRNCNWKGNFSGIKMPKVELSKFNGDDPRSWIKKCQRFFMYNPISEDQKVLFASLHLDGVAKSWFQNSLIH